jgi:predicted transcriptional regulator
VKKKLRGEREVSVIGFEAEPALREQLEKLALEQERSRSWVIRKLLLQALETNSKEKIA